MRIFRRPALVSIRLNTCRTFRSSSAVPDREGRTQDGIGSPFFNQSACCAGRHSRSAVVSCADMSTRLH